MGNAVMRSQRLERLEARLPRSDGNTSQLVEGFRSITKEQFLAFDESIGAELATVVTDAEVEMELRAAIASMTDDELRAYVACLERLGILA